MKTIAAVLITLAGLMPGYVATVGSATALPPQALVLSARAASSTLGSSGGHVEVTGKVKHATSCQLRLLSHQPFPVVYSHHPKTCKSGTFTAHVLIGHNPSRVGHIIAFALVARNKTSSSTGPFFVDLAAPPHPTTTTTTTTVPTTTTTQTTTTTTSPPVVFTPPPPPPPTTTVPTTTTSSTTTTSTTTTSTTTTTVPPPTITAVGSLFISPQGNGIATLSVDPQAAGDALVLLVHIVDSGATVSSVSGGGSSGWTLCHQYTDNPSWDPLQHDTEIWVGKVSSTGTSTIAVNYSGTVTTDVDLDAQEFTAGLGTATTWTPDTGSGQDNAASVAVPYPPDPPLTPSSSGELYFGYAWVPETAAPGSTPGVTYFVTNDGNLVCYDPDVSAALSPLGSQSLNPSASMAVFIKAS